MERHSPYWPQADNAPLLLVFRMKLMAFTCDIRQVYRHISIVPEHRRINSFQIRHVEPHSKVTVTYKTLLRMVLLLPLFLL